MKRIVSALIIFSLLFTSGCWSRREVEDIAIATSMGIDVVKINGMDKFRVSMTFIRGKSGGGAGGGTGGGGGGDMKPFWLASSIGTNLATAINDLNTRSPREVNLAHVGVIVLSKEVAENKLTEVIDYLQRERELRFRIWIAVTKGEALDIINSQTEVETTVSKKIDGLIHNKNEVSRTFMVDIKDFIKAMGSGGSDPITGVLENIKPMENKEEQSKQTGPGSGTQVTKTPRLRGTAVFKKDKLVGFFDDVDTRGFLWVKGKLVRGMIELPSPMDGKNIAVHVTKASSSIKPEIKDGQLTVKVKIKADGDIADSRVLSEQLTDPPNVERVQKIYAEAIKKQAENAIRKAQDMGADIFGFGDMYKHFKPEVWQQVEKNWREVFSTMSVEVEVEAVIRRVGFIDGDVIPK